MSTGIYIHLPYCITKCPYCDFNSYGIGINFPEKEYTESLIKEISMYSELLGNRTVESVFFGGGTPSLFSAYSIEKIIDTIIENTSLTSDPEISLEVNPRTADGTKLQQLRSAGINRISIGIQSFIQKKLDYLRRYCTTDDCERIISDTDKAGFDSYNLDLMYGARDETIGELEHDLECATSCGNKHISVYCLTVEENTKFGYMENRGETLTAGDELLSQMYTLVSDKLGKRGFKQYEISNFAVPGYECRHNLIYWRSGDYIGFGAGAHSHLRSQDGYSWGERWSNTRTPRHYMKSITEGRKPVEQNEKLSREAALDDALMMGLRLSEGVNRGVLEERFGINTYITGIDHLVEDGFIEVDEESIRVTDKGFLHSNKIILEILSRISP